MAPKPALTITLFHNPRCSKSRAALDLLRAEGHEPQIVLYLETPPSAAELTALLKKLGIGARGLLRTTDEAYARLGLADAGLGEAELIGAMVANPGLIERPICIRGAKAVIGRPPETVLDIL